VAARYFPIYRQIGARSLSDEPGTPIRFTVMTEGVKRDGLNLLVEGAQLSAYRKNPIVTWCHDFGGHRPPIGRADLITGYRQLNADILFDQKDEFAQVVEDKYRRGFLNAVSISWNPLEQEGQDVKKWELLDIAAVPVPGDPEALAQRQLEFMRSWAAELTGSNGNSKEPKDSFAALQRDFEKLIEAWQAETYRWEMAALQGDFDKLLRMIRQSS
jgi:hypothetical protein